MGGNSKGYIPIGMNFNFVERESNKTTSYLFLPFCFDRKAKVEMEDPSVNKIFFAFCHRVASSIFEEYAL